jgi:hypothetical protein
MLTAILLNPIPLLKKRPQALRLAAYLDAQKISV